MARDQVLRQDSGSYGAKNVLNALENDTKANFQERIPGKVRLQKKCVYLCVERGRGQISPCFLGGLELSKILLILFENLTSDDMQDDASDMLRFLLKY